MTTEQTCPCKWCGKPTPMLGTKMCDNCWEMDGRIRRDPALARRMLDAYTRPPETQMVGESRAALDANAIEKHRKERARAFAQWELANKPYEGWGK